MAIEESRDIGRSQQTDPASDQGTVAITGAAELEFQQDASANTDSAIASQLQSTPRQISQAEFKQLRRVYFTVRHDRVDICDHKLDRMNQPTDNCEFCWYAWFDSHPDLVKTADRAYIEQGAKFLDKIRGTRFRKMFCRFMVTKLKLQQEQEEKNESGREMGGDSGSVKDSG
jgi:hypothetical protein